MNERCYRCNGLCYRAGKFVYFSGCNQFSCNFCAAQTEHKCQLKTLCAKIVYPFVVCIANSCKSPVGESKVFCSECEVRFEIRARDLLKIYETKGIEKSTFIEKLVCLPEIPDWIRGFCHTHDFIIKYVEWILTRHKTLIEDNNMIYNLMFYFLKLILQSTQTEMHFDFIQKMLHQNPKILICDMQEFRTFCRTISMAPSSPIVWLPNGNIRQKTKLNVYNKDTLLKKISISSTHGILIADICMEYSNAYADLLELEKTGDVWIDGLRKTVFSTKVAVLSEDNYNTIWLNFNS